MNIPELYIIIPCYNEEKVLPITCSMFLDKLQSLISRQAVSGQSRILFVDDGSKDNLPVIQTRQALYWHSAEPQPRASEFCFGRSDGSDGSLRYNNYN